jgi:hypothetical protein
LFLFFSIDTQAQLFSNYIDVNTNSILNFTINDAASLENSQTINNAISIRVRSVTNACRVYARLSNFTAPAGFYPSTSPLALDWTSDTSPNAGSLAKNLISLEVTDKLLFTQPQMFFLYSYYQFNYNLVLQNLSYDYPPGYYNFTILFTMTQP